MQRPVRQRLPGDREVDAVRICRQVHQEEARGDVTAGRRARRHPEGDSHLGRDGTRQRDLSASGLRERAARNTRARAVSCFTTDFYRHLPMAETSR